MHKRSHVVWGAVLLFLLAGGIAQADPAKKKPNYPPPEASSSVGVFGAHRDSAGDSGSRGGEPPAATAAPEIPKVEAEPPEPQAAPPRFDVQSEGGMAGNAAAPSMSYSATPASGYLVDHPVMGGLVAGFVGSDLGTRLFGGPMVGDETAAMIGFGARIALILLIAWLVFRQIGRRASGVDENVFAPPSARREPGFGKTASAPDGRREPTFGRE